MSKPTTTKLTQAEADELFRLTEAATLAAFASANAMATYGSRSPEAEEADKANSAAYRALFRWQLDHGLSFETVNRRSK